MFICWAEYERTSKDLGIVHDSSFHLVFYLKQPWYWALLEELTVELPLVRERLDLCKEWILTRKLCFIGTLCYDPSIDAVNFIVGIHCYTPERDNCASAQHNKMAGRTRAFCRRIFRGEVALPRALEETRQGYPGRISVPIVEARQGHESFVPVSDLSEIFDWNTGECILWQQQRFIPVPQADRVSFR
jgi:hypothetical protein